MKQLNEFLNWVNSIQEIVFLNEEKTDGTFEDKNLLVIFPGGFHPFHQGHYSVYDHLVNKFPSADVYVAATDTQTERPFNFQDKKFLASQSGVPIDRFVQVKNPYQAKEIVSKYDPENTVLVFAVSEKDSDRFKFTPKKDGSPSYFQPFNNDLDIPLSKHGYIYIVPKENFEVAGQQIDSASQIRSMYTNADNDARKDIISDLYPNAINIEHIKSILDNTLGDELTEADNPNYFGGSSLGAISGNPDAFRPRPTRRQIKAAEKRAASLKQFMRRW